ncbi:hypothetical protein C0Q70_08964 [Pomacea canaliculata]|uniref:Helicase ATP-binding domain-containing protein n=1 Tax=Pomacea canaliculata TaxID=400727 RepID=A0A2T7P8G2_POMCA|nr:hypothetical protein C0Q70_08964 [Pomacea canaliculata]
MSVYTDTPGCSHDSGSRDNDTNNDGDVDMEDDDVDYTLISVNQWKWLIQFYRKLLVDVIRPLKIMMKMRLPDLDKSVQQKVERLESEEKSNEAAEYFLNVLLEYSEKKKEHESKAMWSLFDEALKSEYKWLHCAILENGDVELQSQQKELIQFFMEDIVRQVDPMHLMISLLSKDLLSTDECQNLTSIHRNYGNLTSCIYMINNVHRHSEEWYGKLLEIMYENGYEELVKKIDEIEYGKIQASRTEEHAHVSCSEEVYMSGVQQALPYSSPPYGIEYTEAHKSGSKNLCGSSSGQESDPQNITTNVEDLKNYRDEAPQNASAVNQNLHKEVNDFKDLKKVTNAENDSCVGTVNVLSEDGDNRKYLDTAKDFYTKNALSGVDIDNSNAEVDPPEDDLADADSDEDTAAEPIKLRDYQAELVEVGLTGKNVVICAPTGSGKTLVALKIMRAHLEQQTLGVRKIVFLVNQVALADQQYKSCKKYLSPYRCHLLSSDNLDATKVPINELLLRKDVLVMTAQILLNALEKKEINSICEFSMVVFDECHHTHGRHPFNCIMHHYLDAKQSIQSQAADDDRAIQKLPQVIGMTASVGVGKASNVSQAVEHIRKIVCSS